MLILLFITQIVFTCARVTFLSLRIEESSKNKKFSKLFFFFEFILHNIHKLHFISDNKALQRIYKLHYLTFFIYPTLIYL